jgi:Leucine rich repeat
MSTSYPNQDQTADECTPTIGNATDSPNASVIQRSIAPDDDDEESLRNDSLLAESIIRFRTNLHRNQTTASQTSDPLSGTNECDGSTISSDLRDSINSQHDSSTANIGGPLAVSSSLGSSELQFRNTSNISEKDTMIAENQYLPSELINSQSADLPDHKPVAKETSEVTDVSSQGSDDVRSVASEPPPLSRHTTVGTRTDMQMRRNENDSEQYAEPIAAFRVPADSEPVEAVPVVNGDSESKQIVPNVKRTRMIITVLSIVIVTTTIIAATIGGICGSGVVSCRATSSNSDSKSPVKATVDDRTDSIYSYINSITFVDNTTPNRSNYNNQAIDWIVNLDPLQLSLQNSTFRIRQRYALLAFWFHTTIDGDWFNANGWLTDEDECMWYGIACTEIDYGTDMGVQNTVVRLNMTSNNLIGMIPPDLGLLSKLRRLRLEHNALSDTIPESIGQWTDLEHIELQFNNISGTLPESIVKLNKLTHADLSFNYLTGPLPTNLGNLSDMYYFTADSNQFSSTLPSSLGLWTNLNTIDLTFNYIFGSLPEEIGNWRKNQFVLLLDNELTGSLPSSVSQFTDIYGFDVSNNYFVGTIPEGIANWKKLNFAYFYANNFTGSVPIGICSPNITMLRADCKAKVTCECCTYCD